MTEGLLFQAGDFIQSGLTACLQKREAGFGFQRGFLFWRSRSQCCGRFGQFLFGLLQFDSVFLRTRRLSLNLSFNRIELVLEVCKARFFRRQYLVQILGTGRRIDVAEVVGLVGEKYTRGSTRIADFSVPLATDLRDGRRSGAARGTTR